MSIGEAHSARLARERLEAIQKYLPVRDAVKEQLQSRQESQVEFEEDTKQLFKPITETTKDIQPVLGKIAERTKKTKKILKELPAEIAAAIPVPEMPEDADQARAEIGDLSEQSNISYKFSVDAIADIRSAENVNNLAAIAVKSFSDRKQFLNPEYADKSVSRDNWYKWIFRIRYNVNRVRNSDPNYIQYINAIDNYITFIQQQQSPPHQLPQTPKPQKLPSYRLPRSSVLLPLPQQSPIPEQLPQLLQPLPQPTQTKSEEGPSDTSFGSGLGSGLITQCPNNILADVERLEILIGGKRAGNNSSEIINEAADICKRLFIGGIMDINVYQSLIGEIADEYYSD